MSPIEHYFENLLTMGSDIKGEPNKNALPKEVQETIEICADYIKYNQLLNDTKADLAAMLTDLQLEIEELDVSDVVPEYQDGAEETKEYIANMIEEKINSLKEAKDG